MSTLHAFHAAGPPAESSGTGPSPAKDVPARELARWPAAGDFALRITLEDPDMPGSLTSVDGCDGYDDLVAPTTSAGLHLGHGDDARATHLRWGESELIPGPWATEILEPRPFLRVSFRPERARATLEVVDLGARELRETHGADLGLLYVPCGTLLARTTDEEGPFELGPGDGVWMEDVRPSDEWDLVGRSGDAALLWVRIHLS